MGVDFETFRPELETMLSDFDGAKGGRPPSDAIMMVKLLILQASHSLSDERTEVLINDRLSLMRCLGLWLGDRVPDATTIWLFGDKLSKAGAMDKLFDRFDQTVRAAGDIAMSGQIVDASLVAAPRQRTTDAQEWQHKPAKLRQKDRDARWTVKVSKAKPKADATAQVDIAVPVFGSQSHIAIRLCRAEAPDGAVCGHDRDRSSAGEDRADQPGVHHPAADLAGARRPRLTRGPDLRPHDTDTGLDAALKPSSRPTHLHRSPNVGKSRGPTPCPGQALG